MTALSLYVHAPFCARRCCYCDFAVTVDRFPGPGPWLEAMEKEFRSVIEREGLGRPTLDTVYVGGGTPSLLGAQALQELRDCIEPLADLAPDLEWTAEANPESFDEPLAAGWRSAGVNRVSLGAQSFDPGVLRWMGRLHGPDATEKAMAAARSAGIAAVSLDLMFGLPARLGRDWEFDLEQALALQPDHLSLYGLTAEPDTPLGAQVAEARETLADESSYASEYLRAARILAARGFFHYEVSNFALHGRESRHNRACWALRPYIGLGPGAHSFLPPRRWWNTRDWVAYREQVARTGVAIDGEERLDESAVLLERAWLGLRTAEGAPMGNGAGRELVERWASNGWARVSGDRVLLTPEGWLLLDRLTLDYARMA